MISRLSFHNKSLSLVIAAASAALVLVACGGSSATSALADAPATAGVMSVSGTITGFGSVIIDGVRYDDVTTKVSNDTNPSAPSAGTLSDLKLGMRVEGKVQDGKLNDVVIHASLLGPIGALDSTLSRFSIYGQPVQVATTGATPTVFEGVHDFNGLAVGDVVEVHGTVDATKAVVATRVERRPQTELSKGVRIGGMVTLLDTAAKVFKFNDMTVDYSTATVLPEGATPANGQLVIAFSDTPPGAGGFKAKAIKIVTTTDGDAFGVGGRIMAFNSLADFTVSGVHINASAATIEGGVDADLATGVIVGVEGTVANGVLKATKLRVLKTPVDVKASLKGQITDWVSASSFKVRGTAVDASAAIFVGGSTSDLGSGAWVVVTGKVQGDVVKADRIEFIAPPVAQVVKLKGEIRDYDAAAHTFHFLGFTLKLGDSVEYVNGSVTSLINGKRVEVSGTPGTNGLVVVARVEFLADLAPQISVVGGRVFDVSSGGFKLTGMAVSFDANTSFDGGVAADLANGVLVLAKGSFNPSTKMIAATWIEIIKADTMVPRVAGPIGDYKSQADFHVGGQKVDATNAAFTGGTAADLANGAVVEASGGLSEVDGTRVLHASKLRFLVK